MADLGRWLKGDYAVPAAPKPGLDTVGLDDFGTGDVGIGTWESEDER